MIQRIQSIYLLLVTVASVLLLMFPFVAYENMFNTFTLHDIKKPYCGGWYYLAELLNLLILVFSLICIFLYKRRKIQFRLAYLLAFLNVLLLLVLLFTEVVTIEKFIGGDKRILWPSYLPIVSMIFAFLAGRAIQKDEELVRSADRIR
jgi:hypothetical protein